MNLHAPPAVPPTAPLAPAYQADGQPVSAEAFYRIACDPARSVAVEACAGAGKTWMLVSRILRALLDGCAPQDILAITFTKKAAGEMRQRLLEWLQAFGQEPLPALTRELEQRGLDPERARELAPELQALHQRLLAGGRMVQVRTFHSWFAALLRAAPLAVLEELQLPAAYELLEDDSRAVALVWPRFYASVSASPGLTRDFMDSVAEHGRHQTLKALETALAKRVEFALADAAGVVDTSVSPVAALFAECAGVDDPWQLAWREGPLRECLVGAARALGRASAKTFAEAGSALEQALSAGDAPGVAAALLTQKGEPRKFNDKLAGMETVRAAQDGVLRLLAARHQQRAHAHQGRLARLARALLADYAALKRERGWVDMNDIERAALRLLGDTSLAGWMQQRLDARVRHLLIDEFQDTNPLQWQALYAWLSGYAGAGPGEAPRVFLVGDPKQSIYRFRRAEPQVFRAAQAFVVQGLGGALLSCDHTRRCAPAVVDALNRVMGGARDGGEYAGFRDHSTASQAPGEVLVLPAVPRDLLARAEADATRWRDSLGQARHEPEDTLSAHEARQAADWIGAHLQRSGQPPTSVMVLARKRERLGWLHEALRERGIPSEEPEQQDLTQAPAVLDVVALLDALVSPTQDLSLARALRSPLLGWSDSDLAALAALTTRRRAMEAGTGWWDALMASDHPQHAATATRLRHWRDSVLALPPHDALAAIYREADVLARYAAITPAGLRASVLAQLRGLLQQALALDGGRFLTPYRFVRALKAGGVKAPVAEAPGAVRLLTVHGAKGLEADTVLLLDTDARPSRPDSMGVLVDWPGEAAAPRRFVFLVSEKQPPACATGLLEAEQRARALEELNALYVAMTRAEHRLVVSSAEPYGDSGLSWFKRLQPVATAAPVPDAVAHGQAQADAPFLLPDLPPFAPPDLPQAPPDDDGEAARLGKAMHRLLQWRPTPAEGFDWTPAHSRAVAREFALEPARAEQALAMARTIASGEAAWAWDANVLSDWASEIELLDAQGELQRLDRLVRRADTGEWWVLDHKSAAEPERQPALVDQLRRYARAVALAHPGAVVRTAFLTAEGRCVEVSE